MSVPKGKRTPSKMEFFNQAYKLNYMISNLLIKDFGIKSVTKDLRAFTYAAKMEADDRGKFLDICNKYGINVEAEYPMWLMEYYRNWILKILQDMINNITQANTIYPTTVTEFEFRRRYQWQAIGNCYQLLQAMQIAIKALPVNVNKYMPYVEEIKKELEALKHWKKSDNRLLAAIKAKQQ